MPEREQFGVTMEQQLDEWQKKVEEAKTQAQDKGPEFAERLKPDFDAVAARYEDARYKLKLLRMSGQDAWDEMRTGFEKAFDDLKSSLNKALSKF